ncbi:MAG: hypothetical protein K6F98_09875 [Bacteroidales bacterium]|nr:hypothetical protein [Bacteroidales bacterium]MBR3287322.1 hypothetical protein [Bacteroidales bacterium]MCR5715207.1 hypothetical protein [Bacteroidales bacterium]
MSLISDLIMQQVQSAAGSVNIPSNIKNQVLGGLSESVLGSLTKTAAKSGGVDQIKELLTGKVSAAQSPITALAGQLFSSNVANALNLNSSTTSSLTALLPTVLGKVSSFIKDRDGDGDVDLNDIILSLKGGSSASNSLLGMASSLLGGILKK